MTRRINDPHALLLALMRRDFGAFLRKAFPWISGGDPMLWNWHFDAVAYQLEQVANRKCRRLLVSLPPRNGKSKAISAAWVAWMLGRNPKLNFVCVSYSNHLSGKLARLCLAIMEAPWYRELFPRTIISAKRSAACDFETTAGGGRLATSVTGTVTGRGGDIIILDDVIKPDEADSDSVREAVNEWYKKTLASRLDDKATGVIICVMQRLHQYDLAGTMIETGKFTQLTLPAIAPADEVIRLTRGRRHIRRAGDVLHPEREPRELLEEMKAEMGSRVFAAQYQQDPVPALGNILKAAWLKSYASMADVLGRGITVQSWDTANKPGIRNDWSVCVTAIVIGRYVYVIDVFRKRMAFPELKQQAIRLARLHKATVMLVEDQASGQQLIQELRSYFERGVPVPIARKHESDKVSRVEGISAMVEAGQLVLPQEMPWLAELKAELLGFPNARYDDQVDAVAQLLTWVRGREIWDNTPLCAPIIVWADDGGAIHEQGDDVFLPELGFSDANLDPWAP